MTTTSPRVFSLSLRGELFTQVKEFLSIGLSRPVEDDEAAAFLMKNAALLGSLIQYDEVDTTDRERIWECCRTWHQPA